MLPQFSLLRPRLLSPLTLSTITLTTTSLLLFQPSSPFALPSLRACPLLCDSPSPTSSYNYTSDAQTPLTTPNNNLNPAIFKQISFGSILGLGAGLLIGTFSRALALLLGMSIVGVQWLASKGYHVIPTGRIQKYVKSVDVRSAVMDNVAFKIAFGTTFALAGWAEF
jgi:uncharacterized membrane protein (Fun14 family)